MRRGSEAEGAAARAVLGVQQPSQSHRTSPVFTERQLGMRCPHLALLALVHAATADEAARQRGDGDDAAAAAPAGPVAGAADE